MPVTDVTNLTRIALRSNQDKYGTRKWEDGSLSTTGAFGSYAHVNARRNALVTAQRTKKTLAIEVDRIRKNYLIHAILSVMSADILAPDPNTENVVTISAPDDKDLDKELRRFQRDNDLDGTLVGFIRPMLALGEHILGVEKEGSKFRIVDKFIQSDIYALYDEDPVLPKSFLRVDQYERLRDMPPSAAAHFSMQSDKIRVLLPSVTPWLYGETDVKWAGEFLALGESVLQGAIRKVQDLEMLEVLPIAAKLAAIAVSTMVGLQVPVNQTVEDAVKACRRYEDILNKSDRLDDLRGRTSIDVEQIISAARFKVLPVFGDKGGMNKMDIPRVDPSIHNLDDVKDARTVICSAIGIPEEFIFGSQPGVKKLDTIRSFARYVRKLRSAQTGLSHGLMQLVCNYLVTRGVSFRRSQIKITFVNKLVSAEELDKLEFADTIMSVVGNTMDQLARLKEKGYPEGVSSEIVRPISSFLKTAGFPLATDKPMRMRTETEIQLDAARAHAEIEELQATAEKEISRSDELSRIVAELRSRLGIHTPYAAEQRAREEAGDVAPNAEGSESDDDES